MLLYINVHKLKIHFQNHLMSFKKAFIQILSQALTMTALTGTRLHIGPMLTAVISLLFTCQRFAYENLKQKLE